MAGSLSLLVRDLVAGHVVESLLELLGHEGKLADTPDLGVL
jgi:hypothetical protein